MIIGLSGYAGVGKDTLAKYIVELDPSFKIKKFSGKLKEIATLLTGIPIELFESQDFKRKYLEGWGMTVRELLQKLGTETIRDGLHEDAWVNALFSDYHQNENWIITDVRFPNEHETIIKFGGLVMRLERDEYMPVNMHPSETALDNSPFHYYLICSNYAEGWKEHAEFLINEIKINKHEKYSNHSYPRNRRMYSR